MKEILGVPAEYEGTEGLALGYGVGPTPAAKERLEPYHII